MTNRHANRPAASTEPVVGDLLFATMSYTRRKFGGTHRLMVSDELLDRIFARAKAALTHDGGNAVAAELLGPYVRRRQSDGYAMYLLGDSLRHVGRLLEAEQVLLTAMPLVQSEARVCVMTSLGSLNDSRGAFDKAEQLFRRATMDQTGGARGWIWILRGASAIHMGQFGRAAKCYERAITVPRNCDPDEAYLNLGYVRRAQGRYREAIEAFQNALELCPDYSLARDELHGMRDIFEAIEFAKATLDSSQDIGASAEIDANLSDAVEDDLDKMREWAKTAHDREGGCAVVAELLRPYLQCRPFDNYATYLYGDGLRGLGHFAKAKKVLRRALAATPPKGRAHVLTSLGLLEHARGSLDAAEEWYDLATRDAIGEVLSKVVFG